MLKGHIYVITNLINGKQYVGQTSRNIDTRYYEHCYDNRSTSAIHAAIVKYGVKNFKVEELEEVDITEMDSKEQYWIAKLNTFKDGYNKNIGGYNIRTGKVATPTTRLNAYEQSIKQGSYDVYHSTEYDRQLDSTQGKEYTKQAWGAAPSKDGEKYLQGVEFNGKIRTQLGLSAAVSYNYLCASGNSMQSQFSQPRRHSMTCHIDYDKQIFKNYSISASVSCRYMSKSRDAAAPDKAYSIWNKLFYIL